MYIIYNVIIIYNTDPAFLIKIYKLILYIEKLVTITNI